MRMMDYVKEDIRKIVEEEVRAEGRAEGRAEQKAENAIQLAKIMLQNNEPTEKITLYTGLTPDAIERIQLES